MRQEEKFVEVGGAECSLEAQIGGEEGQGKEYSEEK